MAALYAELLDARVMPWDVKRLTNWQIAHVVRHQRDRHGRLVVEEQRRALLWETFAELMKARGLADHDIALRWRQVQTRQEGGST